MNTNSIRYKMVLVWLAAIVVTVFMLSYIVTDPTNMMLGYGGDAAKNYFTFYYHALYGKGIWFDGMNYPYGEHIIFTDAQPALIWLHKLLPFSVECTIHYAMGISYVLSIVYLYKICTRFNLAFLFSLASAVLITVMSPQVFKLSEHFSLAYVSFVPMLFYYTLSYHLSGKWKWVLYLFLFTVIATFFHVYYLAIIAFWVAFYVLGYVLFGDNKFRFKLKRVVLICLPVVLAFGLFYIFLHTTDPITDRPDYPSNTRAHVTSLADVFTSSYSPLWVSLKNDHIIDKISNPSEGYAYAGIVPIILFFAFVILGIRRSLKHGVKKVVNINSTEMIWLLIVFGMLFIGSGIVFIYCFECLDNASILRQFRALGRLSWGFYYPFTVLMVVGLYRLYLFVQKKNTYAAYTLISLAFLLWGIETYAYVDFTRTLANQGRNNYHSQQTDWVAFLKKHGLSQSNFQAILYLPYVHIGSEKLGAGTDCNNLHKAFDASLQLGLPLMDVMMSRTSWSQTFKQVKIEGGVFVEEAMLPGRQPLMLMVDKECSLDRDQKNILEDAKYVGDYDNCDVYIFNQTYHAFDHNFRGYWPYILDDNVLKIDTCHDCNTKYYIDHFDQGAYKEMFFDEGAVAVIASNTEEIAAFEISDKSWSTQYEFSIWVQITQNNYRMPDFHINCYNENGQLLNAYKAKGIHSKDNHEDWFRVSKYFTVPEDCYQISMEVINIPNPAYRALDELLIRPAASTVVSKDKQGRLLVNNHVIE